jgi:hypothetical protein
MFPNSSPSLQHTTTTWWSWSLTHPPTSNYTVLITITSYFPSLQTGSGWSRSLTHPPASPNRQWVIMISNSSPNLQLCIDHNLKFIPKPPTTKRSRSLTHPPISNYMVGITIYDSSPQPPTTQWWSQSLIHSKASNYIVVITISNSSPNLQLWGGDHNH